jgi:integrase
MPASEETRDLERWKENVANGSRVYAEVSARRLRAFLESAGVSATDLVRMSKKDLRNSILDYLAAEKKKGHSGEYIRTTTKAIRSWLVFNGKEYPKDIKIPNAGLHPRIAEESTPTTDDLRKTLVAANSYEKVAIGLVAFAGLRLHSLGNFEGTDGLTVADFPEMKIEGERVSFVKVPTLVRVREALSKADHAYFTFLGEEGCRYLKLHLEERIQRGEKIGPASDIVTPTHSAKKFVRTINVGDRIRKPMRAVDVAARPYAWRSYFFQKCLEAQSATGKVPDRVVEFFAGHRGDVTSRHYSVNKPNPSEAMLEEMRSVYAACAPYLETSVARKDPSVEVMKSLLEDVRKQMGSSTGSKATSVEEIATALHKLIGGEREAPASPEPRTAPPTKTSTVRSATRIGEQRSVDAEAVESFLEAGWSFVSPLNSHLAVVRWDGPVSG